MFVAKSLLHINKYFKEQVSCGKDVPKFFPFILLILQLFKEDIDLLIMQELQHCHGILEYEDFVS